MQSLSTADGRILADTAIIANTFPTRMKGLLGYPVMPDKTALILEPCDQVHMFFMRFAIGVVFLDKNGGVLFKQYLKPWQVSKKVKEACVVVETKPEVLDRIRIGEVLIYKK
ncbi:MAG: DUF192 domain-containing protein [Peptococcaceae bacterium]|nr:DUF192 domain-containing protein [Peptococcaceae bacterium]